MLTEEDDAGEHLLHFDRFRVICDEHLTGLIRADQNIDPLGSSLINRTKS